MSYQQAMKWAKKHPKGTRQPMIFSTGSGPWPVCCSVCDKHFRDCNCAEDYENYELAIVGRRLKSHEQSRQGS